MSHDLTPKQIDFLRRFLGVEPSTDGTMDAADPEAAASVPTLTVWQTAKDKVDAQLRALSDKLRKSPVPEVVGVADEVETLLEPVRVKLVVALKEFDTAPGEPKARDRALEALATAETWLDSDARVRGIDTNPWGVPVSVAATLGAAFDRLHRNITTAGGAAS